jgi:hypothetical protein
LIDRYFHGSTYSLRSLFQDERKRIVGQIVESTLSDAEGLYRRLYEDHGPLMCFLSELQYPMPPVLRLTTEFVLAQAVCRALQDQTAELDVAQSLLDVVRRSGFSLDASILASALRQRLNALVDRWMRDPCDLETLQEMEKVIALSRVQPFELNLWKSQNAYYELSQAVSNNGHGIVNDAWLDHFRGLGKWLGVMLPQLPSAPCKGEDHAA